MNWKWNHNPANRITWNFLKKRERNQSNFKLMLICFYKQKRIICQWICFSKSMLFSHYRHLILFFMSVETSVGECGKEATGQIVDQLVVPSSWQHSLVVPSLTVFGLEHYNNTIMVLCISSCFRSYKWKFISWMGFKPNRLPGCLEKITCRDVSKPDSTTVIIVNLQ